MTNSSGETVKGGEQYMPKIEIDLATCNGCASCVDVCPMEILVLREEKAFPEREENCMICKVCEVECPTQSIRVLE